MVITLTVRRQLAICHQCQEPQRRQSVLLFLHKMRMERPRDCLGSGAGLAACLGRGNKVCMKLLMFMF